MQTLKQALPRHNGQLEQRRGELGSQQRPWRSLVLIRKWSRRLRHIDPLWRPILTTEVCQPEAFVASIGGLRRKQAEHAAVDWALADWVTREPLAVTRLGPTAELPS
jgi:hypothetical protein